MTGKIDRALGMSGAGARSNAGNYFPNPPAETEEVSKPNHHRLLDAVDDMHAVSEMLTALVVRITGVDIPLEKDSDPKPPYAPLCESFTQSIKLLDEMRAAQCADIRAIESLLFEGVACG